MRSSKYAILFFGFTFLAFFLYEMIAGGRIHAIQYLMVGASQCIFYLLLLSLPSISDLFGPMSSLLWPISV